MQVCPSVVAFCFKKGSVSLRDGRIDGLETLAMKIYIALRASNLRLALMAVAKRSATSKTGLCP